MVSIIIALAVGYIVSSFTVLQILVIFFFGIPLTKRLERLGYFASQNPIIKRYFISIILLGFIYSIFFLIAYSFNSPDVLKGFIAGTIISILISARQYRMNRNNFTDYLQVQSRYFIKPVEELLTVDLSRLND